MEGISSLHSWIKTQTMIRPAKLGPGAGGKREGYDDDEEEEDDDVIIPLTSRDPNMSLSQVRWDHTMGEFLGFNFSEMMIDHLNIESTIHHVESLDAQLQVEETNKSGGASEAKPDCVRRARVDRKNSDDSDCLTDAVPGKLSNQFSYIERATQHPHMIVTARNSQTRQSANYIIGHKKTSRNTYFMLYI